jgi:hypothetical protein
VSWPQARVSAGGCSITVLWCPASGASVNVLLFLLTLPSGMTALQQLRILAQDPHRMYYVKLPAPHTYCTGSWQHGTKGLRMINSHTLCHHKDLLTLLT